MGEAKVTTREDDFTDMLEKLNQLPPQFMGLVRKQMRPVVDGAIKKAIKKEGYTPDSLIAEFEACPSYSPVINLLGITPMVIREIAEAAYKRRG